MSDYIYKDRVDWTKPIQTRGGLEARYLGVFGGHIQPNVVLVISSNGTVSAERVYDTGQWTRDKECAMDIINVPIPTQKRTYWMNLYSDGSAAALRTKAQALTFGGPSIVARIPVTVEFRPGDGLSL